MKKLIYLISYSTLIFVLAYSISPELVLADCANPATAQEAVQCGANQVGGGNQSANPDRVEGTIENLVNIFSILIGVVAVIMIMVAGLRYISSGGDQSRVKGAKDTLMYAVIGLIIVALAQVLVRFVFNTTTSATSQGECIATPYGYYWHGGPNANKPCRP